jgi:uncharacterized damage-inducible protein DinB
VSNDLATVFDHILGGFDIPDPASCLRVSAAAANASVEPLPTTIAENLAHAVMWQNFWLGALRGGRSRSGLTEWTQDWRKPEPKEWPGLRAQFIEGLREARRIAASDPMDHQMGSDAEAVGILTRIAVHGAYHLGQINQIKRAARRAKA